ncbi:ComEC/Rec2 family competence protein, partial [Candidatus Dependentiae bacterium]
KTSIINIKTTRKFRQNYMLQYIRKLLDINTYFVLLITVFFIFGILFHASGNVTKIPFFVASTTCLALAILLPKYQTQIVKIAIIVLSFFLGYVRADLQIKTHQNFYAQTNGKTFDIVGTVKDMQKLKDKFNPFLIKISVQKMRNSTSPLNSWKKVDKHICLYLDKPTQMQVGDTIILKYIKIKKPKDPDFIRYLIKQDIAATTFSKKLEYEITHRPHYCLSRLIYQKRQHILCSLKKKMPARLFSIFSSIFLGNKNISQRIAQTLKIKFKTWGILHFLARSGLHLIIFLIICEALLKLIPLYFYIKQIIILLLSIVYLLLSWPSVSFIRAFSALVLYKICPFLRTKPILIHVVTVVCFAMLFFNPIQLFFLDFQLSFILTFTLAIFGKIQIKPKLDPTEKTSSNKKP